MGEIADMMLDGTMCQGCGVWLHDGEHGPGFPGWCADCQLKDNRPTVAPEGGRPKIKCPIFGKRVREVGLKDHQRDAHGVKEEEPPSFSPNFDERNGIR